MDLMSPFLVLRVSVGGCNHFVVHVRAPDKEGVIEDNSKMIFLISQ